MPFKRLFRLDLIESLFFVLVMLAIMVATVAAPAPAFAAAGVTADVTATIDGQYTGTNALGTVTFKIQKKGLNRFTAGVTAQKADKLYAAQTTIAASGTLNLDLAGALLDPFGAAFTPATVKTIYVHAAPANTNNVCVGGHASAAFLGPFSDATDVMCVKPGGTLLITAPATGWTVTATTADLLKIANSGGTTGVTFDLIIIGTGS